MFTVYENSKQFELVNARAKECLSSVLSGIAPSQREINVPRDETLCDHLHTDGVYLLRSGFLRYEREGRLLFFVESGELVGWGEHFHAPGVRVYSDFAVVVDKFDRQKFFQSVESPSKVKLWNQYVTFTLEQMCLILSQVVPQDVKIEPELRQVEAGQVLIVEGTTPNEVFTLLNGEADVFKGDVKVGSVLNGEIFGAMAAATGMTRSASVVARTDCLAMVIPKEHFLELTKTHPHTVQKLIEDMSRIIVSQNEKIVNMTRA